MVWDVQEFFMETLSGRNQIKSKFDFQRFVKDREAMQWRGSVVSFSWQFFIRKSSIVSWVFYQCFRSKYLELVVCPSTTGQSQSSVHSRTSGHFMERI